MNKLLGTMQLAPKKSVKFSSEIAKVGYTLSSQEYDRTPSCVARLTYQDMEELIRIQGELKRAYEQECSKLICSLVSDTGMASVASSESDVMSSPDLECMKIQSEKIL